MAVSSPVPVQVQVSTEVTKSELAYNLTNLIDKYYSRYENSFTSSRDVRYTEEYEVEQFEKPLPKYIKLLDEEVEYDIESKYRLQDILEDWSESELEDGIKSTNLNLRLLSKLAMTGTSMQIEVIISDNTVIPRITHLYSTQASEFIFKCNSMSNGRIVIDDSYFSDSKQKIDITGLDLSLQDVKFIDTIITDVIESFDVAYTNNKYCSLRKPDHIAEYTLNELDELSMSYYPFDELTLDDRVYMMLFNAVKMVARLYPKIKTGELIEIPYDNYSLVSSLKLLNELQPDPLHGYNGLIAYYGSRVSPDYEEYYRENGLWIETFDLLESLIHKLSFMQSDETKHEEYQLLLRKTSMLLDYELQDLHQYINPKIQLYTPKYTSLEGYKQLIKELTSQVEIIHPRK